MNLGIDMNINKLESTNSSNTLSNISSLLPKGDLHISRLGKIEHTLFMLTIFFYPISLFSHLLYIIPQLLLLVIAILNRNKKLYMSDFLAFLAGITAFMIPLFSEYFASSPNYDLASKLLVNVITIIVIAGDKRIIFSEKTLNQLTLICIIWIVMIMVIYLKNGVTSISAVYSMLNSGSDLNSSSLYGIAEPLRDVFLTKNISAMFVISVFSLYLYVSFGLNKTVNLITFSIFFLATLSFLSRQSIMAMIVLYGFYRFMIAGYLSKGIILTLLFFSAFIFFTTFFDLKNSNDGASQRLLLWQYFFQHYQDFLFLGLGMSNLNNTLLNNVGIDNFHMFFMNQIGAYGIYHFIAFTLFLGIILMRRGWHKGRLLLVLGYLLNVCFQTYGYEYGNLFLFLAMYMGIRQTNAV